MAFAQACDQAVSGAPWRAITPVVQVTRSCAWREMIAAVLPFSSPLIQRATAACAPSSPAANCWNWVTVGSLLQASAPSFGLAARSVPAAPVTFLQTSVQPVFVPAVVTYWTIADHSFASYGSTGASAGNQVARSVSGSVLAAGVPMAFT